MKTYSIVRRLGPAAAIAVTLLLAACETQAPPPPPPPPPPPAPPITMAPRLIEDASAWRAYMNRTSAISADFKDGEQIQVALRTAEAHESRQFQRGAVAYAAILALQDPTFVQGVRTYAADPANRLTLRDQIIANPNTVVNLPGAESAAGLIVAGVGGEGQRLLIAGRAVKQAAYDVQRQAWSKKDVVDRPGRLVMSRTLSTAPMLADANDSLVLSQAYNGAAPMSVIGQAAPPPWSPLVIRGMAVAALAALGEAGEANAVNIDAIADEQSSGYCLKMAKLNMYQCLAVSKPHYEDIFCLGQHIMMDTGQCLVKGTGAAMPPEPPKPVVVAKPAAAKAAPKKPAPKR